MYFFTTPQRARHNYPTAPRMAYYQHYVYTAEMKYNHVATNTSSGWEAYTLASITSVCAFP